MSKNFVVEALIASPPTSKCQETMEILEELVRMHPDTMRLVVYQRGIDIFPSEASMGMKTIMQKGSPVPAVIINSMVFSTCKVPMLVELEKTVQELAGWG
jgi:hypothetical protein